VYRAVTDTLALIIVVAVIFQQYGKRDVTDGFATKWALSPLRIYFQQ
jgi:hypothetical protein